MSLGVRGSSFHVSQHLLTFPLFLPVYLLLSPPLPSSLAVTFPMRYPTLVRPWSKSTHLKWTQKPTMTTDWSTSLRWPRSGSHKCCFAVEYAFWTNEILSKLHMVLASLCIHSEVWHDSGSGVRIVLFFRRQLTQLVRNVLQYQKSRFNFEPRLEVSCQRWEVLLSRVYSFTFSSIATCDEPG